MIRLPPDHNFTTRTYPRSMRDAFKTSDNNLDCPESTFEEISRFDIFVIVISLILWVCIVFLLDN
jgi:hypothetical protein